MPKIKVQTTTPEEYYAVQNICHNNGIPWKYKEFQLVDIPSDIENYMLFCIHLIQNTYYGKAIDKGKVFITCSPQRHCMKGTQRPLTYAQFLDLDLAKYLVAIFL